MLYLPEENIIRQLYLKNNTKATVDFVLRLGLHFFCIYFGYRFLEAQQYFFAMIVLIPHFIAYSFLGWAGIGHELFHNTVFTNRKMNQFLFRLLSVLTWNNYAYFEVTHWKHHKQTLHEDDPEANPSVGIEIRYLPYLILLDIPGVYRRLKNLFMNVSGKLRGEMNNKLFPLNSINRKKLFQASFVILTFHLFMIGIFILLKLYWLIALISFAPFVLTIFNRILAISQHYGISNQQNYSSYFHNTRTVKLDVITSFLYANMNYHIEHHFFPQVPYYNLKSLHNIMRLKNNYVYYHNSFWELLIYLSRNGGFK